MAEILGENYGLSTVAAPHGLLHMVHHNGNHRTAAIRAAGFPVALVETERYESPWMLPLMSLKARAHMRLLFRAGLLSNPHVDDEIHQIFAEGDGWVILLLLAASPKEAVKNVVAYEHLYGRCEAWPEWLRDGELLDKLTQQAELWP